jgi:heme-degrading monooxygenase HmoA
MRSRYERLRTVKARELRKRFAGFGISGVLPGFCETVRGMELDGAYVWVTSRKLKPGSREEFSRSWRPREFPEGMLRAYELVSPDGNEVVGVSVWDSIESRDRYRRSEVESERRRAMAPYVLEEVSGFYVGRELKIPRD